MSVETTLNSTLGLYLLATFAAAVLFGITNLQVYVYYRLYPEDGKFLKVAVAIIWALDALILAFNFHVLYYYLIVKFGDLFAIASLVWSFRATGITLCILIPFLHSLYAVRVWKLYRPHKIIPIFITICVTAGWVVAIVTAQRFSHQLSYNFSKDYKMSVIGTWSVAVIVDTLISAALCWRLYQPKRQFSCTNSIIRDIVLWIIGTGILTCACTLTLLAALLRIPGTFVWVALSSIVPKIATNGFLAILNVRHSLRATASGRAFALPKAQRANERAVQAPLPVHIPRHAYTDVIEVSASKVQSTLESDSAPAFSI